VLNWSISRNYKEIWNSTKISVTSRMYLTRGGNVQRPLTSRPRGWPTDQIPWLARFYVSLARGFLHTCLHEKGKAKAVEAEAHGQLATWLSRSATTWRVIDITKSVTAIGTPINTPLPMEIRTHKPHFGDSTCKAPIISVVARRSLVERVVRLCWPEGFPACR
jgi:hypothetical protein